MKISQFVIKNSSELDFSVPLLVAIKKKYPQATIKVIYCTFSKTQILRGATFYSDLFRKYEIVEYDFLDFLITNKRISNYIRNFTICSGDRVKISDLTFSMSSQKYFSLNFFKNIRTIIFAIYQNLIVFLQKKLEYVSNFKRILEISTADIYFLGNRTKTRFKGRELLFKKFYSEKKPVVLLPHGTHEVHAFEDAIEFNEFGEKISSFNDFWHSLAQEEPWQKLGGDLNQYFHSGHPGLDQEWLDSLEIKNLPNDRLTCLFIARKFLNKGIIRPDGMDQFTLNYDEMLNFINNLGDALLKLNNHIELIIKPHPSNNFHVLNQLMHESRCKNWKLSSEPIYALLGGANFAVSVFSTTLPIISAFGLPVVLLDSDLQKYVHERWPLLEKIYGNYKLKLNNNCDLGKVIKELLADKNRLLYCDREVIRKYFLANANKRAINRIEQLTDWSEK